MLLQNVQGDLETNTSSACGKIILTGEYAVVFGYPGIAVPAPQKVTVTFEEDASLNDIEVQWSEGSDLWSEYVQDIINYCITLSSIPPGTLTIENEIPLNKGMGSSTAFVIAICKALLGEDCEEETKAIEDALNPGHSGIDFTVIWNEKPILFRKGQPYQLIDILVSDLLKNAEFIDTGTPDQKTPELVAWVTERKDELRDVLAEIGTCTDRLAAGEDIKTVIRDHHQAQCSLGVVIDKAKELITKIEQEGGAAKVLGAGSRTGGCGMVLSL